MSDTAAAPLSPHVWAVGSGKGGAGKSVIAARLAITLARRGRRVVAIDLDLGGANLHTLLGVPPARPSLGDFLDRKGCELEEVMVPTGENGLKLVSGARSPLEIANLAHSDKTRILRQLDILAADDVVLDLGAGTSFNVLDFFLAADRSLVVVGPEPTSVENAYQFLKAAFLRRLRKAKPRRLVEEAIARVENDGAPGLRSPKDLVARVLLENREAGTALLAAAASFRPLLVVNRLASDEQRRLGEDMAIACSEYFGSTIRCPVAIPFDPVLAGAVQRRSSLGDLPDDCLFTQGVGRFVAAATSGGGNGDA